MTVSCPRCKTDREVGKVQFWRLSKGLRKECKSCSVTGRVYPARAGKGFSPQAREAQKLVIKGNQYAKGFNGYTTEEKKRRSEVMLGNKFNPAKRGANNPSWRGGKGTERHTAMGRSEYKIWRDAIFKRDNYTCQVCTQYSGYLHADHIEKWSENDTLRYSTENGRTLCRACHYYITFKQKMPSTSKWGLTNVIQKEG